MRNDQIAWDTKAVFGQGFDGDWLELNNELFDSASVRPLDSALQNQKPDVHVSCTNDFTLYNSIIDEIAADLKHCLDFNAFIPWYWCSDLDSFVASTITNN